jgi:UPF0716 protein FxsA
MVLQMRLLLIAILLGFPLLEALVLLRLAQTLGWWVLAWVVMSACAGVALLKNARYTLVAQLAAGLANGEFSIAALGYSARTVLAGLLLIFPGVVSDFIAITLLLLPGPRMAKQHSPRRPGHGALIEGEFRRGR